jgi:histone deacetylase 6
VCRAEGLHLIDFEQLKIENQSLNEKIEERNEELVKLRKKTTVTVQVSTRQTRSHLLNNLLR